MCEFLNHELDDELISLCSAEDAHTEFERSRSHLVTVFFQFDEQFTLFRFSKLSDDVLLKSPSSTFSSFTTPKCYSPIVEMNVVLKLFSEKRKRMHVLPTPVWKERPRKGLESGENCKTMRRMDFARIEKEKDLFTAIADEQQLKQVIVGFCGHSATLNNK